MIIIKPSEMKNIMTPNPKTHDALFKWLISAFTEEFFAHYFPEIRIGKPRFIDKEFISRYEALKESLKGDLFLAMEVEISGEMQEIVIQIEHQSERENAGERAYEYSCYAWLLKRRPVWSIVIYTDDAHWRKRVAESFWYAFDRKHGKQFFHFDVIKVRDEKSEDLIRSHSLMCKLLALKADDRDADPEKLVHEIYRAAEAMGEKLDRDHMLLIGQWVSVYKKIPDERLEEIKKEVKTAMIATTISEHIFNEGKAEGKAEGKLEGKAEGKLEGKLEMLENLYLFGIISKEQYEKMTVPLREQLRSVTQ